MRPLYMHVSEADYAALVAWRRQHYLVESLLKKETPEETVIRQEYLLDEMESHCTDAVMALVAQHIDDFMSTKEGSSL